MDARDGKESLAKTLSQEIMARTRLPQGHIATAVFTPNQKDVVVPGMITALNTQDVKVSRPMAANIGQWT